MLASGVEDISMECSCTMKDMLAQVVMQELILRLGRTDTIFFQSVIAL